MPRDRSNPPRGRGAVRWDRDAVLAVVELTAFGRRASRSAQGHRSVGVGTLVERTTRYLQLLDLPDGREAEKVNDAVKQAITVLPEELRRTITWDQGKEMSRHAKFTIDTGIQVYFCDPHSPWQRGTNENTNGLLRQYMPKGTDLSVHTADVLAEIARSLNNRPRKALGYMTPSEKFAELLAPTD